MGYQLPKLSIPGSGNNYCYMSIQFPTSMLIDGAEEQIVICISYR